MTHLDLPINANDVFINECHSSNHRARNLIGEKTLNYTLEVRPAAGATHAIVTEVAGPANTTVAEGDTATLACRYETNHLSVDII